MAFWDGEIKELGTLYDSFKGHLPDIVKELEQLVKTDDPNVVMLYSRRCLEVIVTDLCENELKRPRKTEPLKGIIDKLNAEEKVPSHIITSMISLNSMANYGAHPKDFDPEQVKPVLNNLAIIIRWYLKYKDFKIVSKVGSEEKEQKFIEQPVRRAEKLQPKKKKSKFFKILRISLGILLLLFLALDPQRFANNFHRIKGVHSGKAAKLHPAGTAIRHNRLRACFLNQRNGSPTQLNCGGLIDFFKSVTAVESTAGVIEYLALQARNQLQQIGGRITNFERSQVARDVIS